MDIAVLGLQVDATGAIQSTKALGTELDVLATKGDRTQAATSRLSESHKQLAQSFRDGAISAERLRLLTGEQNYQTILAIAEVDKLAASHRQLDGAASASSESLNRGTLQLGLMRRELGTLLGRLTGTNGAMDRMAGSFGAMALGNLTTIWILAGLAAVAAAYNAITKSAGEAREAQDAVIARGQAALRLARLGPGGESHDDESKIRARIFALQARAEAVSPIATSTGEDEESAIARAAAVAKLAQITRELTAARESLAKATKDVTAAEDAERDVAYREISQMNKEADAFDAAKVAKRKAERDKAAAEEKVWRDANFRDFMAVQREVADRNEKEAADDLAFATQQYNEQTKNAERAYKQQGEDAVRYLKESAKEGTKVFETMWRDIQRDVSGIFSNAVGGGPLGKIFGDIAAGGIFDDLKKGLTDLFSDGGILGGFAQNLKLLFSGAKEWLGSALGSIGGALASPVGLVAGIGLGLAALFGAFDDDSAAIRRHMEALNAYTTQTASLARELHGGGSTVFDQFAKFRADTIAAIGANSALTRTGVDWLHPYGTGQTAAGMAEERRLLAALAEAEARLTQQYRDSLHVRLLTAQGHAEEASALKLVNDQTQEWRDLQLSGADAVTLALLQQAQAAERAAFATAQYAQTISGLQAFQTSLTSGSLTTLSPGQQLASAQQTYEALLSRAQGGDQGAAGQLSGAAQAYLTASRGYNASGTAYAADFSRVQSDTTKLIAAFEARATASQQALDAAVHANEIAQAGFGGIIGGVTGTNNRLDKLQATVQHLADTLAANGMGGGPL